MLRYQATENSVITSGAAKKGLFSLRDNCNPVRKNIIFSCNSSMGFATKSKTKKLCTKEWSKKHIFLSHFFIFHHKPKHLLKFLRNGFWIVIVQKIRKKCLSHSGKMHFSVSGHVTLGVVRWRHELDYICPLWVLSKFGPIEAYMCRVIASWFFPSKRHQKIL